MPRPATSVGKSIKGGLVQFQSRHFGNITVATPAGRLDHAASVPFEQGLKPLWQDKQAAALVVDFSDVEYISSVGLRVLMIAAKEMRKRKARIAAVSMQPIVAEIFTISRFDSVFEVFPSLREALTAMSEEALAAYDGSFP
jgi:anti-sigma B factor antagonist/stage II sporulation protein AA (anti-sigma F factor antagonist)